MPIPRTWLKPKISSMKICQNFTAAKSLLLKSIKPPSARTTLFILTMIKIYCQSLNMMSWMISFLTLLKRPKDWTWTLNSLLVLISVLKRLWNTWANHLENCPIPLSKRTNKEASSYRLSRWMFWTKTLAKWWWCSKIFSKFLSKTRKNSMIA